MNQCFTKRTDVSQEAIWGLQLLLDNLAISPSARVEISSVLIPHLPSCLASSILPAFHKASVPVGPDNPVIEASTIDEPHSSFSILPQVELKEAKAAGGPLELVQPHHHPLHLSTFAKELVDLLFCRVEAHVAHVERGALTQKYRG